MNRTIALLLLMLCLVSSAAWAGVSRDANGWTVVTPSGDTRIIYVSSSTGNDAWTGISDTCPVASIAAGSLKLRNGYPDWLLLKSGDCWNERISLNAGGRSSSEPLLVSRYGTGPRPQINPIDNPNKTTIVSSGNNPHIFLIGLDIYDPKRDPGNPAYQAGTVNLSGMDFTGRGDDLLIEDCYFRFLAGGITIQGYGSNPVVHDVRIRRNIIADTYANSGFCQGSYFKSIVNLVIEENVFDHNSWNDAAGVHANIFNHHIYIESPCSSMTITGNLFLRCESLSLKIQSYMSTPDVFTDSVIENNLFFEGEVGLGMGTRCLDSGGQPVTLVSGLTSFRRFSIRHNVFLQIDRDNPTGRGLGWGMLLPNVADSVVSDNIFSDFSHVGTGNTFAIKAFGEDDSVATNGDYFVTAECAIRNNIAYRVATMGFYIIPRPLWSAVTVSSNTFVDPDQGASMTVLWGPFSSLKFSSNTYSPTAANPADLAKVSASVNGSGAVSMNYAQWTVASGEIGSRKVTLASLSYKEPGRNLDTYQSSHGGGTANDFISLAKSQTRANWDARTPTVYTNWNSNYTAMAINDYIRDGFNIPPQGTPSGKTPSAPRGLRIR
jgi:hypothetical protein